MASLRVSSVVSSLIAALGAVALVGCMGGEQAPSGEVAQKAGALNDYWPTLWPNGLVPVCWETGLASDGSGNPVNPHTRSDWATISMIVRDTMRSSWGRYANIDFSYFGDCPSNSPTGNAGYLAINIARPGYTRCARTTVGYQTGTWTRMRLSPDDCYSGDRLTYFAGEVMHETGHALGFDHEFKRPDNPTPGYCNTWKDPDYPGDVETDDNLEGTPYDERSIMNFGYCYLDPPYQLTPWDIVGVQNMYGRRAPGTMVAATGSCLNIFMPYSPGRGVQLYECQRNAGNATWLWEHKNGTYHFYSPSLSAYLDVPNGSTAWGLQLDANRKNTPVTTNQQWYFQNTTLRGMGETCIDIPYGNYVSHNLLQIFHCAGSTNQNWVFQADGTIHAKGNTNYCIDVPNGATANGTRLQLFTCNGGANQKFTFTNLGEIQFGGKCFDVGGGTPNDNSILQLFTCKSATDLTKSNQLWHLSGGLVGQNGLNVEVAGGSTANQTPIQQNGYTGALNQQWDYYFDNF